MTDVRGEKLVLSSRSVLSYVAEVPASTLAGVPEFDRFEMRKTTSESH